MGSTSQFQSEMSDLSPEHDNWDKLICKNLIKDFATDWGNSKMKNVGWNLHSEFIKQLERVNDTCHTLTWIIINRTVRLHLTSLMYEDECVVVSNDDNGMNDNFSRDRDDRPVGTTIVPKHENELCRVKNHNDISMKYTVEKRSLSYGKRLTKVHLYDIIDGVIFKYGLDSSDVCSITIRKGKLNPMM